MRRRRRILFWLVAAALVLGVSELAAFVLSGALQKRYYLYRVPVEVAEHYPYQRYLQARDPLVGWPYPEEYAGTTWDRTGVRPSPAFPDSTQPSRVSLYGDSFTYSAASDAEAWCNQLAVRIGARVANHGVGGYGSDQALLRFERNQADTSDVVILGHVSENILRNLTRNRDLLTHARHYAYKPRFVIDASGNLQQIPIPTLTDDEHLRFIGAERPWFALPHENFQPGGPAGTVEARFPYLLSVVRSLGGFRLRARLAGRPEWAAFYERDHPLHGLPITGGICRRFARVAKERGKVPIVLVLPCQPDLEYCLRTGRSTYENLVTDVRSDGTHCFEFGARLLEHLGSRSPGELFDPTGHYRPEVDALLAEFVARILGDLKLPR